MEWEGEAPAELWEDEAPAELIAACGSPKCPWDPALPSRPEHRHERTNRRARETPR